MRINNSGLVPLRKRLHRCCAHGVYKTKSYQKWRNILIIQEGNIAMCYTVKHLKTFFGEFNIKRFIMVLLALIKFYL